MPMITKPSGPLDANCHIYHNESDAIIFDPATETDEILEQLDSLGVQLRAILLTHLHFDHTYGCAKLMQATSLPVFGGQGDIDIVDELMLSAVRYGLPQVSPFEVQPLSEGEYDFGSIHCKVLHVPGHSPGSLCYYISEAKAAVVGDVLFYRSIGRTDLPCGNFSVLEKNIKEKLYTLPQDTMVYTGHGLETNIGDEKRLNPFVTG